MLFFARRVRRGACETSVSGFCRSGRIFAALVCLGECEVFASELALAEACADPKIGAAQRPQINLGPRFLLATKSGSAPRTCNWSRRKAQPEGLWWCCCL